MIHLRVLRVLLLGNPTSITFLSGGRVCKIGLDWTYSHMCIPFEYSSFLSFFVEDLD